MAKISTHILSGVDGTHAEGIEAKLLHQDQVLASSTTQPGGRMMLEVDLTRADPAATYDLVFNIGPYWATRNVTSRHIKEVVLRFDMPDPDQTYHMPIIISPNGYSTWASG